MTSPQAAAPAYTPLPKASVRIQGHTEIKHFKVSKLILSTSISSTLSPFSAFGPCLVCTQGLAKLACRSLSCRIPYFSSRPTQREWNSSVVLSPLEAIYVSSLSNRKPVVLCRFSGFHTLLTSVTIQLGSIKLMLHYY